MDEKKIPVIIDTDPGVDDALAIMIAAASEKIHLLGLTPVDGNVSAVHTHRNALDLVSFLVVMTSWSADSAVMPPARTARPAWAAW